MNSEGRIINVSSISHYFGRIRFEDLTLSKRYDGLRAYEQSKLAVVLFTYELARRLRTLPVTVNVLSPGRVNTTIGDKNASGIYRKLWLLNKPILLPVSKGAATYLYLAMDKRAGQFTGKYFYRCRPVWSSLSSYNHKLALKLWQFSESLTEKILQSNTKHENLCT
jgi:NAD(P)-dependent dehydrogenase (short-subunit alcohol dehydrogenase family)